MSGLIASLALLGLTFTGMVQAQSLVTITETGSRSTRLNLVMLSEGYTAAELSANKFKTDAITISNALLTTEPFKSYRPFFNVYGIAVASAQSGSDFGSAGGTVSTYFNSTFNTFGIDRLLTIDSTGYSRATSLLNTFVPEYSIVLVIVNDSKYGGSGGTYAVTSTNSSAAEIAIHEIGHSFAGLGDEYDYAGSTPTETPDTTQETRRAFIKWNHWINTSTPIPTPETSTYGNGLVGLFEGAAYNPTGWYRPTLESKMQTLGEPFYAVNEEAIVLSIYQRVSPVTSSSPTASTITVNQPNQTLTFNVDGPNTASTAPAIKVDWKLDGISITGQTGRTLNIDSSAIGNGSHTLVANVSDPTPKVRLDQFNLLKDSRSWPLNLTNQGPNAPTNLAATRMANGNVSLTWTDNANDEADYAIERALGTSTTYTEIGRVAINATTFTDTTTTPGTSTKYRVRGVNATSSTSFGQPSNVVTVLPEIAPAPVSSSGDVTVVPGNPASFSVQASGIPLNYQWRRNSTNISGANKASYSISSAQLSHAGSYDCVVSNDVGSYTSTPAILTVNVAPSITVHPSSATVLSEQAVVLSVQATGTPSLLYQWRKNNVDIPGETSSTLLIAHPDSTHTGSYTCRVSNAFGFVVSKTATLTVLGPPVITQQPVAVSINRGAAASFSTNATGTGTLSFQWRRNGLQIVAATGKTFALTTTSEGDAGSYDCVIANAYGSVTTNAATLAFASGSPSLTDYKLAGINAGKARWLWAKQFGGADVDEVNAIVQSEGHIVICGQTANSTLAFGSLKVGSGFYTASLNASNGLPQWAKLISAGCRGNALFADGLGSVYSAGENSASPSPYAQQSITTGAITMSRTFGESTSQLNGIVRAGDGTIYVVRHNSVSNASTLSRIDSSGTALWELTISAPSGGIQATDLALVNGLLLVSFDGVAATSVTLANAPPTASTVVTSLGANTAGEFALLAAYSDSGNVQWTRSFGSHLFDIDAAGTDLWCASRSEPGGVQTCTATRVRSSDGQTQQTITLGTQVPAAAIAACPDGGVAALVSAKNVLVQIGNFNAARSGVMAMRFDSASKLRWLLPVWAKPQYAPGEAMEHARISCAPDGRLAVAVGFTDDAAHLPVEFAGLTTFSLKGHGTDIFVAAIGETPVIENQSAHQMVALGQPLHLSVTASPSTGLAYQWLKDGRVLTGKTTSTLDVAASTFADAGSYACKIAGSGGTVQSPVITVNVIDTTSRTLKAPLNKSLDLPASASGPGLSFTWWKNGARIFNTGGFANATTSKLRINAMSPAFADNYVCKVSGLAGTLDVPFVAAVMYSPVFTSPTIPASIVSGVFDLQLSATDAASFKVTNLPAGLTYSSSTGRITGKPTTAGAKTVTVTATNAAGSSSLFFTISVADLQTHLKGTHQALLGGERPWLNELDGLLTFTVSSTGATTGSLRTAIGNFTLVGSVDADPLTQTWHFRQRFTRTGKPALVLDVDSANASTNLFAGTLIEEPTPGDVSAINGHRAVWSSSNPATTQSGTYNASLQASLGASGATPLAPGTLKAILPANTGVCTWSGKLGDTTALSGSTYLSPSSTVPLWQALYSNQGQLIGSTSIAGSAISGTLQWKRKQVGTGVFWSDSPTVVNGTKVP